jgi:hypothetical protein
MTNTMPSFQSIDARTASAHDPHHITSEEVGAM